MYIKYKDKLINASKTLFHELLHAYFWHKTGILHEIKEDYDREEFITEVVAENIQFIGSNKKENNQPSNFFENFSNKDTNDVLSGLDMTDDTLPF